MSRRNSTKSGGSALSKLTIKLLPRSLGGFPVHATIASFLKNDRTLTGPRAKQSWLPLLLLTAMAPAAAQNVNVLTYHNDNARTGQDLKEGNTNLLPSTVNSKSFGKLFVLPADGKVDAEPLYMSSVAIPGRGTHNVLFVATEHDSVYAYDADTEAKLWQVSMLKSGETTSDDRGCGQVSPEIGVTATPVIVPTSGPHGTIYVVAMSKESGQYHQRVHALDITTGAEEFGGPVDVQATYPGSGDNSKNGEVIFDPSQYKERPGLLVIGKTLYTAWSSHCDFRPYTGWLISYNINSLVQTGVLNITPNGNEGSIWASGAGPAADSAGNIYFLAANGTFDTTLNANGFPKQGDYGNAFMKVTPGLKVADYFTMFNTVGESNADEDLGSGGALVLPDMIDANHKTRHLAVGAGKDQNIYLVDRDNMGKFNPKNNNIYQELAGGLGGEEFAMPAFFNNTLYYGGAGDVLRAFQFASARLDSNPTSTTRTVLEYPGTTPSISANGTNFGIVWAAENSDPAVLHAYDASDLANELYNSTQAGARDQFGAGNKFITPMIANGKVYVGTTTGVGVFGHWIRLSTLFLGFPPQPVHTKSAPTVVTFTSNAGLTIKSITTTGDFAQTSNCGNRLAVGGSCTISVTFTPTQKGNRSGKLTITDSAPDSPHVVNLDGTGR